MSVSNIPLRALTPRELYNAMGFPRDYIDSALCYAAKSNIASLRTVSFVRGEATSIAPTLKERRPGCDLKLEKAERKPLKR